MKSKRNLFLLLILITSLSGGSSCSSTQKKTDLSGEAERDTSTTPVRPTALSREAAHLRARQLSHVSYSLWFGLDETHDDYEGRVVVNFDLRPKAQDLSKTLLLDFEEGAIHSLTLNGQPLITLNADAKAMEERFDGHRITFKSSDLHAGNNRVEIAFTHPYSHNGAGLHRFKDPADGLAYLYSNFEPYDAHRMFPCFDQPDLKASYELTVEAPESWQVISNTTERDVATVDGRKSWQFPPSPVFSTYVFALHAGPYAVWKGDAGGIPIRLFARQSIKQYVEAPEWLDITKKGLDFYSIYFGYPYPYAKYDQLIVPDFNAGAMENVGAVTFSERYVYRSKETLDRHRGRADTILHEMAHMWFGDLVTMRWWNGLWLNESFATFMAAKAVNEATNFKGSWQDFFAHEKQWAYWEDQLVTTHPIEVPVFDTDQAATNFDGITYGKGASSLKQLNSVLGDEDFREGLERYFQKYALHNTTVTDFVKMLSEAASRDLSKWQKSWLQTSGVNTVRAEWTCNSEGKVAKFVLLQTPAENSTELRSHHTQVALYKLKGGKLHAEKTYPVQYDGSSNPVHEIEGASCPDLVYPNHQDEDYVKVELDTVSLKTATQNLGKVDDPFARQMIWHNLWEMVTDGKLKAQDYAAALLKQGITEKDTQVLSRVLKTLIDPLQDDVSVLKYLPLELRGETALKIEKVARDNLMRSPRGSDLQLIWFRAFLDSVHSQEGQSFVRKLLAGKAHLPGLALDQVHRWEAIRALARAGHPDAHALIAAELKIDNTDMGQKDAILAEVGTPDPQTKQAWLKKIIRRELPYPKLREAMRGFQILGQEELTRASVNSYFEQLPKLAALGDEEYLHHFASSMYPGLCDPAISARTSLLLTTHPELPATIVKSLKIGRQEDERCVRARAKASEIKAE